MVHQLFVYGTLRQDFLRERICSREVPVLKTVFLKGFKLAQIGLGEEIYPIIIEDPKSDEVIEGDVIEITTTELGYLDQYEGLEYQRKKVLLSDNTTAWAYIH